MRLNDAEGITASKWLTINDAGGSAPIPSDGASVRIFMKSGKLIFLYASSEESPQYWFFNLSGSSDQYLIYNGNTEP